MNECRGEERLIKCIALHSPKALVTAPSDPAAIHPTHPSNVINQNHKTSITKPTKPIRCNILYCDSNISPAVPFPTRDRAWRHRHISHVPPHAMAPCPAAAQEITPFSPQPAPGRQGTAGFIKLPLPSPHRHIPHLPIIICNQSPVPPRFFCTSLSPGCSSPSPFLLQTHNTTSPRRGAENQPNQITRSSAYLIQNDPRTPVPRGKQNKEISPAADSRERTVEIVRRVLSLALCVVDVILVENADPPSISRPIPQ